MGTSRTSKHENKKTIENISTSCRSCSTYSVPPFRFQNTVSCDKIILNRELSIYLMYLNKKNIPTYCRHSQEYPNCKLLQYQTHQKLFGRISSNFGEQSIPISRKYTSWSWNYIFIGKHFKNSSCKDIISKCSSI